MKIYDRDELHWPDAQEVDRAMQQARRMRSECLAELLAKGIGAIGRTFRTLMQRYRRLQRSLVNSS